MHSFLLLLSAAGRMDQSITMASARRVQNSLPGQGEPCASGCGETSWPPWEADEEQKNCCAEGLVCDQNTSTCELALGQACYTKPEPKKKKGLIKRKFQKYLGKKEPEEEKPQKCGRYFGEHQTVCLGGYRPGSVWRCCVKSYDMNNQSEEALGNILHDMDLRIPSPYAAGKGHAYAPPDGTLRQCCSGLGYQWPDGDQACVVRQNEAMAKFQKLKKLYS